MEAALARAHELRKFEIENYWKRSTYAWGFQLASFAAIAFTAKDGQFQPPMVTIVAAFGIITALAALLTAKGSKFWQRNWESHVDLLENAVEGKLHKTVLVRELSISHSVSRVNERLLQGLLLGWITAFVAAGFVIFDPSWLSLDASEARWWQVAVPGLFAMGVSGWLLVGTRSDLKDRSYDFDTMKKL